MNPNETSPWEISKSLGPILSVRGARFINISVSTTNITDRNPRTFLKLLYRRFRLSSTLWIWSIAGIGRSKERHEINLTVKTNLLNLSTLRDEEWKTYARDSICNDLQRGAQLYHDGNYRSFKNWYFLFTTTYNPWNCVACCTTFVLTILLNVEY